MILGTLVSTFVQNERGAAVILSDDQVTALAVAAVRTYAGYADLDSVEDTGFDQISDDTDISVSEWTLIRPLMLLYIERETALQMEATGMQGVSGFGRSSSEVAGEISAFERDLQQWASNEIAFTVGGDSDDLSWVNNYFPYGFNYPIY